jgi:hypothetical protein
MQRINAHKEKSQIQFVGTKHLPRFSLQAQFKASNVSTWRTFSSSRLFPTMTHGTSRMFGRTFLRTVL